jgi:hypothetical protein
MSVSSGPGLRSKLEGPENVPKFDWYWQQATRSR